jgi:hypothetical protein
MQLFPNLPLINRWLVEYFSHLALTASSFDGVSFSLSTHATCTTNEKAVVTAPLPVYYSSTHAGT